MALLHYFLWLSKRVPLRFCSTGQAGWCLLVLTFFTMQTPCQAQDPIFSQFFAAPLQINPAFAGVSAAPRLMLNYRNQWPLWPNAYQTYALAYEQDIPGLNSGWGLAAQADAAGDGVYKTQQFSGFYSYTLRTRNNLLVKLGLEGGLASQQIAWDRLVFGDQLDPRTGLGSDGLGRPSAELAPAQWRNQAFDFSAGVLVYGKKMYFGLSTHHLNQADNSFLASTSTTTLGRPIRYSLQVGAQLTAPGALLGELPAYVSPNLLVVRQGSFTQINAGAYFGLDTFYGGLWYRHSSSGGDAVIFLAGYRYGIFRLGYSYDATISGLGLNRTGGAHEMALSLSFDDRRSRSGRRKKIDLNDCLQLFR